MKSNGTNIETKQSDHPKGAHRTRNWWMLPVVAMLASPAPSWSQFKEPVVTEFRGGGLYDWAPTFSSDMLEVYWVASYGNNVWDVWGTRRESIDASWQDAEPLDAINTDSIENAPHLSYDGLTLTFASNRREGGYGGLDLWQTKRASRDAPWLEPVNMGPTINTRRSEGEASFSPDGLEVIFNNGCSGGPCGPSRLRRSTRETLADEWTTSEEMTPSERGDQLSSATYPSLSPDGLSLIYSRPGSYGNHDVFVSKRSSLDSLFGEDENLGATINSSGKDTAARLAPDGSLYYLYNTSLGLKIWRAEAEPIATPLGDFDTNGVLDVSDIDDLLGRVATGENSVAYDLNDDALVNTGDIGVWVKDLANTWFGDANLDGQFDSGDLVEVFKAGQYEDGIAGNSTWATGDWNGDREFDTGDLVAAFQDGGFEAGPRAAVSVVPEPTCATLLLIGALGILRSRKRR